MAESTTRILGYADRLSAAPGERLELKLSCTDIKRYRLDFVQIVCGDPDPRGPGLDLVLAPSPVDGEYRGRFQPIDAGSYVRIDDTTGLRDGASFAVGAFIWPTAPIGRRETVLGWWSEPDETGFAREIDEGGRLRLRLGTGERQLDAECAGTLRERRWHFVAASFDGKAGRPASTGPRSKPMRSPAASRRVDRGGRLARPAGRHAVPRRRARGPALPRPLEERRPLQRQGRGAGARRFGAESGSGSG